jgi:type II secretory pathway component PulK
MRPLRRGSVLIVALAVVLIVAIMSSAAAASLANSARAFIGEYRRAAAEQLAEAGIAWAQARLREDPQYAGETHALGTGEFEIRIERTEAGIKILSVGRVGGVSLERTLP